MKLFLIFIMCIYMCSINQAQPNEGEPAKTDDIEKVQRFHISKYWERDMQHSSLCFITDSIKSMAIDKVKSDIQYFYLASDAIAVNKIDYNCFISSLENISFSEASFESPGNRIMEIIVVDDTGFETKYRVDMNKDFLKMDSLVNHCLPTNSRNVLSFIHEE